MRLPLATLASLLFLGVSLACSGGSPNTTARLERPPPTAEETRETIAALAPPKRTRPLIAVLADNAGTETTDFIVPYGVLRESNLADVIAVAPTAEPIELMPALRIRPQETTASFDALHPLGADYVIVPAMHQTDAPAVLDWIRTQSTSGAIIVAICAGALVVAETGLLDHHAATTHWFEIDALERQNPTITRVDDRRYVVDRGVVTTTGVSASVPISLALVEAIGGSPAAFALAGRLGASDDWSAAHESAAFRLDGPSTRLVIRNWLGFWRHEKIGLRVEPDVDEIALSFRADAYSRTYRSKALAVSKVPGPLRTKRGLELLPDLVGESSQIDHFAMTDSSPRPLDALDEALDQIQSRYGADTASLVALQLEYLRAPASTERGDTAKAYEPVSPLHPADLRSHLEESTQ